MKIVGRPTQHSTAGEIPPGDAFWRDNNLYVRLKHDARIFQHGEPTVHAVRVSNGEVARFAMDSPVIMTAAELLLPEGWPCAS